MSKTQIIKTISYNQNEILDWIINLHCKTNIELDTTYSKGNFYKGNIKSPKFKFDSDPQFKTVIKVRGAEIPLGGNSINTAIFDPPFLATKGNINKKNKNNLIIKRFGYYDNENNLHQFYIDALKEFYRVLKYEGILIFKCQDKVSGGTQYFTHKFIMNEAEKIGYYCKDLFVLLAKNRIVANWQSKNQKNARKYHCYFLVLQKINKKTKYIKELDENK